MAKRKTPLVTARIYHVYNRGVEKRSVYSDERDFNRFIKTIEYYLCHHPVPKLSDYLDLAPAAQQLAYTRRTTLGRKVATCLAYTCMPNHFHLLLEQTSDRGLTQFLQDITNSYTRYFNTKHQRVGPLFQGPFKAILVESDEQLLHVSRYIHLNPLSSGVVSSVQELLRYPWSSIGEYVSSIEGICDTEKILSFFNIKKNSYREFLTDNADYQRHLEEIKHLTHE